MPQNYQKPGQNATSFEVESFIKDKYVNKRWAASGADPASLYWSDRKKFDKLVKRLSEGAPQSDEDTPKKKKKDKKKKHHQDDEEKPTQVSAPKLAIPPVSKPVLLDDLISFDSIPAAKPSGPAIDGFTDFVDADPLKSTDNDFTDF